METADVSDLMTVAETAKLLRRSRKGIYSLVAQRKIPFIKTPGRLLFARDDVLRWLQENRVPASEVR